MAQELGRIGGGGSVSGGGRSLAARDEVAANRALLEFQSPTVALVAKPVPTVAHYATYVLASLLAVFLGIAGTVPIDRVVSASGKVVSQSSNMLIQPLETSIVRSIDVKVGQQVHKGDLLARLDPTFAGADLEGLKTQTQSLKAEVDRLTAEGSGGVYVSDGSAASQLQAAIFQQRRAERGFRVETYRQKISSLASTMAKAQGEIANYTEQLRIANDMLTARQRLEREGVGSKFNTQQALSQATEERRALGGAIATAASAKQDMDALIAERDGYIQQVSGETSQQLNEAQRKLADASDQLAKAQKRHDLVEMHADQDAVVLAIASVSPGSVLSTAEPFITLVPDDATMEIDAAIPSTDVGFVRVGDEVTIKFDAYRFFEHGYAEGHVRVVSPDSQATPTEGPDKPRIDAVPLGQSLYKVKISIDNMKMTNLPKDFRLQPGLGIDADIKVGKRTMLSYLLSRFIPAFTEGMREP
jgi:HlyD family secretion protein